MTVAEGKRVGIDRFPNFHKTGSIRGMKKLYYGDECLWCDEAAIEREKT